MIVVLDKGVYIKENANILSDTDTYLRLTSDPTQRFKQDLEKLVLEGLHLGVLTKRQAEYIIPEYPSMPIYNSLPKLPKTGFPTTFHQIVSGIFSLN